MKLTDELKGKLESAASEEEAKKILEETKKSVGAVSHSME